jgi:hypothetical protein
LKINFDTNIIYNLLKHQITISGFSNDEEYIISTVELENYKRGKTTAGWKKGKIYLGHHFINGGILPSFLTSSLPSLFVGP